MNSLRLRLLLGTALGTAAVLVVSGVVLYALISRTLWAEFDAALATKACSLAALAEQDEDGLELEPTEVSLPEFEPGDRAEYYEFWLPDGSVFTRSASLGNGDLPCFAGALDAAAFETARLPDGRPGRLVGMTFSPRRDRGGAGLGPPITLTLVLARDAIDLQATLTHLRVTLVGVCLATVAASAGVLAWIVRSSLRPVEHLSEQIARINDVDLSARIDGSDTPSEMTPIVDRLNDLLARLDAAFQRERRFTGDVAHELRTPLAGLRSKLELALARHRDPAEHVSTMEDCLAINLQMQRTVENLLHLARADAGQLEVSRERVNVSEVVLECWKALAEQASSRRVTFESRFVEHDALETDRASLRLVLQNVLENAVLYTNAGGHIKLTTAVEDGAMTLAVGNTGCTLSDDDVGRVFERFWRGDASHHGRGENHCGLGLPLCRAVLGRLGGTIEATVDAAGVFTVTVRLPLAA